jgi:hypothetical protein
VVRAAFNAAASITASPEMRDVLVFGAQHQRLDAAGREAYLSAVNTISASAERAQALAALLGERTSGAGEAATPQRSTSTPSTHLHEAQNAGLWNSDLIITGDDGRVVRLVAVNVVRGSRPDDIREIRRGGSLMVEERRRGVTRRADLTRASDGGIARSYRLDGQGRPFDAEAERWLGSILREFTRS